MKKYLLFVLASAVFISCKTTKQTTQTNPENYTAAETKTPAVPDIQDSLLASIERTGCYGTCPIYKFSIYISGYARYDGKHFVAKEGNYETRLSPSTLAEIKKQVQAVNYFGFNDVYPKKNVDFPSVKTVVVVDGKRKEIMDGSGAPEDLKEFEKFLDAIADSAEWRQVH